MKKFKKDILLARFSNYKIGGPARFFLKIKAEEELIWAAKEASALRLPVFVLGGGTNLLMSDKGFRGVVIKPDFDVLQARGEKIAVGAGVSMAALLTLAVKNGLGGLEWSGGLPGTVGGAIRGNAGAFGGEIKDNIVAVRSFDLRSKKFIERSASACNFDYRSSIFKKSAKNEIIVSAEFRLKRADGAGVKKIGDKNVAYRKKNHPLEYPNIGSIFKNVPVDQVYRKRSEEYLVALRDGTLTFKGSQFTVKTDPFPVISAAKLISESGLRGTTAGGAQFSEKHPNFIVNRNHATAKDVKRLIALAKSKVKRKFGVQLEEEVQII